MSLVIGSVITAATGDKQQVCEGFDALVSTSILKKAQARNESRQILL